MLSKQNSIFWPSGDCIPVLGTKLTLELLAEKFSLKIFREKDDLDWFTGAIVHKTSIGPILIMKHDNNPHGLTAFYVDRKQNIEKAQNFICEIFALKDAEIAWRRGNS